MISILWDLQVSAIIMGERDFPFWEIEGNSQATLNLTWKKCLLQIKSYSSSNSV